MKRRTCGAFRRGAVNQRSVCGKRLRATEQLASASGKDPSDSCYGKTHSKEWVFSGGGGGMFAISSCQQIDVAFGLTLRLEQAIGKGEGVLFHKPPNLAAYATLFSLSSRYNSLRKRHICGVIRTLYYGSGGGIRMDELSEDGIARM